MKNTTAQYSIIITLAFIISIIAPQYGILLKPLIPISLFTILFISGLAIKDKEIIGLKKDTAFISLTAITRIITVPIAVYYFVGLVNPVWQIPLTLLVLAPVGISSSLFTGMLGGKTSISLTLTIITSFLAPFWIPIFSFIFFQQMIDINWGKMIIELTIISVVPIILAEIIKNKSTSITKQLLKYQKKANYILILTILIPSISSQIPLIKEIPLLFIIQSVAFTFVIFILLGLIGWGISIYKSGKEEIAVITSFLLMNYALSVYLATTYYEDVPLAVIITVLSIIPWNLSLISLGHITPLLKKKV